LATSDEEVDLAVGLLECTIGVAPFGRWWWSPLLAIVVTGTVVILAMSIITPVVSSVFVTIITAIITTITSVVVAPFIAVVAFVISAAVAAIIASIPIIIARIGPAVTVISSIRLTVTVVEALATVTVVVAVASDFLGGSWDSQGTLQLLALPHGVLGVAVKLALLVHDHIEVTFEEGGRPWWIVT
jgi:hypothetical protein